MCVFVYIHIATATAGLEIINDTHMVCTTQIWTHPESESLTIAKGRKPRCPTTMIADIQTFAQHDAVISILLSTQARVGFKHIQKYLSNLMCKYKHKSSFTFLSCT